MCNDSVIGNVSVTRNFTIDLAPPAISLWAPAAGYLTNSTSVTFNVSATDDFSTNMSGALYIDGVPVNSTISLVNNTPVLVARTVSEGYHTWYVSATDQANNTNFSATRNFTVDLTAPAVQLNSPPDLYLTNSTTIGFNFTPTDNLSPTMNCSLWIDGVLLQLNNNVANNTALTFNQGSLTQGQHSWYILCRDQANNSAKSATRGFTIDLTPPAIAVSSPLNGSRTNNSMVTFSYTPTDNMAAQINCSLYVDSFWQGNFTVNNNTLRSDGYPMAGGNHTWYVLCTDQAGNTNNSGTRRFTVDLPPVVALNAPSDGTWITSSDPVNVTFNFTATDDYYPILNCTFYLDGGYNYTNSSALNNTASAFNRTLGLGAHTWYVRCNDSGNNTAVSPTYTVTVAASPPPSGGGQYTGGGGANLRFSMEASQVCPGDKADVYVSTSSGPVSGVSVRAILTDPYGGLVAQYATDYTGHVVFFLDTAGTYRFMASRAGYENNEIQLQFTPCGQPPAGGNVTPPQPPTGGLNVTPPENVTPPQPPPQQNDTMAQAQQALADAQSAISDAQGAGKNVSAAQDMLAEAQDEFSEGNYQEALDLANQAKQLALGAAAPPAAPAQPPAAAPTAPAAAPSEGICGLPLIIIGAIVVIVALGAGAYMMFGQKKKAYK